MPQPAQGEGREARQKRNAAAKMNQTYVEINLIQIKPISFL